jgi:hypothetical protein
MGAKSPKLGARMGLLEGLLQSFGRNMGVDLSGSKGSMAQDFLDCSKVSPTF